jgi:hypothetical protein
MQIPDTWLSWEHLQWLDLALPFFFAVLGFELGAFKGCQSFFCEGFF